MSKLLLIILVQLAYVPMLTLRTISMVKNLKFFTAFFGFLEALIYIFGLSIVLSGEQSYLEMVIYSVGFTLGLIVGIYVEQKLAIGFIDVHVNINHENEAMVETLREKGFGVTVFSGKGRLGARHRLDILTQRKKEKELMDIIYDFEPEAFVISYEPKTFKGGYLTEIMKKRLRKNLNIKKAPAPDHTPLVQSVVEEITEEAQQLKNNW
ncbi:DUF2179 domain-containing protein [Vallitaleaceae bacterium 9-2]